MSTDRKQHSFKKVVSIPLMPDYAEEKDNYLVDMPSMQEVLEYFVVMGYSISISRDFKRENCSASAFGKQTTGKNAGMMLYANAPSVEEALEILYVKHFLVASEGEWEDVAATTQSVYS